MRWKLCGFLKRNRLLDKESPSFYESLEQRDAKGIAGHWPSSQHVSGYQETRKPKPITFMNANIRNRVGSFVPPFLPR